MSPTARSLKLLRDNGFTADVAERFNSFTKQRKDLFGFVDAVALAPGTIMAIQSTTAANQSARIKKIVAEPRAMEWLKAGGRIYVHGWRRKKLKRGGTAVRWHCNEIEVTAGDFLNEQSGRNFGTSRRRQLCSNRCPRGLLGGLC